MKYIDAAEILPEKLLREVQTYIANDPFWRSGRPDGCCKTGGI